MKNLKRAGTLAAIFLVTAGLLVGCESSEELARKPELVDKISSQSVELCDLHNEAAGVYKTRLGKALEQAYSSSLDTMIAKDVTICLDSRLPEIEKGTFENTALGVYYKDYKVLGLYDNGKTSKEAGFFEHSVNEHSGSTIDKLADKLDQGDYPDDATIAIAGRYSCGKNCINTKWKSPAQTFSGSADDKLEHNPDLYNPPLKDGKPVLAPGLNFS